MGFKEITKSGFLEVSAIHKLYYEVCGNPNGETLLFLHGGPGAGFADKDKRFFNFEKQQVVFYDQRGASRSLPFGSIAENTTQDLVEDINKLLDFLNLDKVTLFGGSWGTALALIYAIQFPDRVKELLLRGVYIVDKESTEHFLEGGVAKEFPEVWKRFSQNVPKESNASIIDYYLDKMQNGNTEEKKHFAYEWAFYEISIFKKGITSEEVDLILNQFPYESLSIMETHYLSKGCFIKDNYILDNLDVIDAIPMKIVHGKDDTICPVSVAIELNSRLKNCELYVVEGGHSDSEPEIETKLIELINKM